MGGLGAKYWGDPEAPKHFAVTLELPVLEFDGAMRTGRLGSIFRRISALYNFTRRYFLDSRLLFRHDSEYGSGLAGYSGEVWMVVPPPKECCWMTVLGDRLQAPEVFVGPLSVRRIPSGEGFKALWESS